MSEKNRNDLKITSTPDPPVHKAKAQETHRTESKRWYKTSQVKKTELLVRYPDLYEGASGFPWKFLWVVDNGMLLNRRIWQGLKRNGPEYFDRWLDEYHFSPTKDQILIIAAFKFFLSPFITYDQVIDFFIRNRWGNLELDTRAKQLARQKGQAAVDSYEIYSQQEEDGLRLERMDSELRKKAEEENAQRLTALKKELDDIQFGIGRLSRTIDNFKKAKKFEQAAHFEKELEKMQSREAHVRDAMNNWWRDSRGRPAT